MLSHSPTPSASRRLSRRYWPAAGFSPTRSRNPSPSERRSMLLRRASSSPRTSPRSVRSSPALPPVAARRTRSRCSTAPASACRTLPWQKLPSNRLSPGGWRRKSESDGPWLRRCSNAPGGLALPGQCHGDRRAPAVRAIIPRNRQDQWCELQFRMIRYSFRLQCREIWQLLTS